MKEEEKLEKQLRENFEDMRSDDVHFDRSYVSDVHIHNGEAVGKYSRTYETYHPGRDTDYSGIVYTDGQRFETLIYQKAMDTKGEFIDESKYIQEILDFDGQEVLYQTRDGSQNSINIKKQTK